ncbi:hypothetical protein [uncultured Gimesia sp.]|uniref:hypothetical protein n=1 Tax=uncultured Gimesia sp. TaxID=1678688 RepID=UPI002637D6BC|nr:hypothetical protein [uncultured Gimesia sp.]
MRFKDRFNDALASKNLPAVDWGQGIWQQVLDVYSIRKVFVHVVPTVSHQRLLATVTEAEFAIKVLREGIQAVLDLEELPHPSWVNDDDDRGWNGPRGGNSVTANLTAIHAGVGEDDPNVIRITYLLRGEEHISEIAPPNTPHAPLLDRLVNSLNVPVDAVRAYRGSDLLEERTPNLR